MNWFTKYVVVPAVAGTAFYYGIKEFSEYRTEKKIFDAEVDAEVQRIVDSIHTAVETEYRDSVAKARLEHPESSADYGVDMWWQVTAVYPDGSKHLLTFPFEMHMLHGIYTQEDMKLCKDSVLEEAPAARKDDDWYPGYVPDGHVDPPPVNIPPSTAPPF